MLMHSVDATLPQRQTAKTHRSVTQALQPRPSCRLNAAGTAASQYRERPVQPGWEMQLQQPGPASHLAQRYHDAAKLRRRHDYRPQHDQQPPLLPDTHQQQQQRQQQQWRPPPPPAPQHIMQPAQQAAAVSSEPYGLADVSLAASVGSREPVQQQLQLQLAQQQQQKQRLRGPQSAAAAFALWLSFCDLHARSDRMVDWHRAAHGLERLVAAASSPLQAQQAWQVALLLQGRPLHLSHARRLGGAVVSLVELTLRNHDHGLLRQLMGHSPRLSLSRRHVGRLIAAAAAADVGLEELTVLLELLPQASLSSRLFFVLVKSFMQRQQWPEAAHCFHKMTAAGLPMSPALQAMQQQLRARSSASSASSRGSG